MLCFLLKQKRLINQQQGFGRRAPKMGTKSKRKAFPVIKTSFPIKICKPAKLSSRLRLSVEGIWNRLSVTRALSCHKFVVTQAIARMWQSCPKVVVRHQHSSNLSGNTDLIRHVIVQLFVGQSDSRNIRHKCLDKCARLNEKKTI